MQISTNKNLRFVQTIFIGSCAFILVACNTTSNQTNQTDTETNISKEISKGSEVNSVVTKQVDNNVTAVQSLLNSAYTQQQSGNTSAAIRSLERAIRIAPRHAESYVRLAEIRYEQENYMQATHLANKALSLGISGPLKIKAHQLIEQSLEK